METLALLTTDTCIKNCVTMVLQHTMLAFSETKVQ